MEGGDQDGRPSFGDDLSIATDDSADRQVALPLNFQRPLHGAMHELKIHRVPLQLQNLASTVKTESLILFLVPKINPCRGVAQVSHEPGRAASYELRSSPSCGWILASLAQGERKRRDELLAGR